MGEEVVAVALQIVADEIGVIAVGDEAHALGEEGIFRRDLFQPDRSGLARDLGKPGEFVDQLARADAAQREREAHAERQTMQHGGERKADQGRGERAAENDDDGVDVVEHPQVAAHQDERDDDDDAGDQPQGCGDIHELPRTHNATQTRAIPHRESAQNPSAGVLRGREGWEFYGSGAPRANGGSR